MFWMSYVSPDYQGTGIGTHFIELIEADLKKRDEKGTFCRRIAISRLTISI